MPASIMYRPGTSTLDILKKACSDSCAGHSGNSSTSHLFHELGFTILRSNLALKYPDFPPDVMKRQYEGMLGVKLNERFE
ncbi:MAG: hypothetical protein WBZ29_09130, partial [Methanocella sp.]